MAYILGVWGEAERFLGIWGAKANTFRETRTLFAGGRGDQCIICRDQGCTDPPPGGASKVIPPCRVWLDWLQSLKQFFIIVSYHILVASLILTEPSELNWLQVYDMTH